ncbi:DNA polymerase III subunit epsilon [Alkalicoccus saliphilus]|jgi:DNA polymerase III subunit epsilon|uniref:DNA polymerase III subunit epsilon n=2 Tax=Alkalicoccus saliphilus TaxID=200989 RepID=A0A2T4U1X7_9BACI|nr:exonuclease domain-containing protein [Alkalicoccus saliphilus]PTL37403.1 DNA polymerase III subunit epsilon [Alkalicoccus saliphilus]
MMFWKKKKMHYQLMQDKPLNTPIRDLSFTVFDTEATGFAVGGRDRMIEIGAVQVENLQVTDRTFQTYVNPNREIPDRIQKLTGITEEHVANAPEAFEAIESFYEFIERNESDGWVGHYLAFDVTVLKKELLRYKYTFDEPLYIDTLDLIGFLAPSWDMRDLQHYALNFGTKIFERHSAVGDALTTAHLLVELLHYLEDRGKTTLGDLSDITSPEKGSWAFQR